MTPQEIQRTMDFILRSNADAFVRMDLWEEKNDRWQEQFQEKLDRLQQKLDQLQEKLDQTEDKLGRAAATVQQATKLSMQAMRDSRRATAATGKQAKKIKTIEKSTRLVQKRSESMRDLMKMAMRLFAHQSKRLDDLEKGSTSM